MFSRIFSHPDDGPDEDDERAGRLKGGWLWVTIVFSAAYLCTEAVFNAHLLDIVGSLSTNAQVRHLEFAGRLVAAAGVSVLVFSMRAGSVAKRQGQPDHPRSNFKHAPYVYVLVTTLLVCVPAVFYGEKAFIDYLARASSGRVRRHAADMLVMRKGLAAGDVKIKSLPYEGRHPSPTDKTFLALSGAMVFSNPKFLREVAEHRKTIVRKTAETLAYRRGDADYKRYRHMVEVVNHDYDRYYHAYKRYEQARDNVRARADKAWVEVNSHLVAAYHRYKHAEATFNQRVKHTAREIAPKLRHFIDYRSNCTTRRCTREADSDYRRQAAHYFHHPPPWTYWCNPVEKKAHNIPLLSFRGRDGRQHHISLGWGKKVKTGQYRCPLSNSEVERRLRPLAAKRFKHRVGAPIGLSYKQFINAAHVRARLDKRLRKRGIKLPGNWRPSERDIFLRKAQAHIRHVAYERYRHGVERRAGVYIRPGLSRNQFYHLGVIQRRAKHRLHWHRRSYVSFTMSEKRFQRELVLPRARRRAERALHALTARQSRLGPGQKYAKLGRSYVKGVIVPPIVLALSLFLGLCNLLKLVPEIWHGVSGEGRPPFKRRLLPLALIGAVVLGAPFALGNKISDSATYQRMLGQAHASLGVAAWPFGWIMRTEPAVYPFADRFKTALVSGEHLVTQPVKAVAKSAAHFP